VIVLGEIVCVEMILRKLGSVELPPFMRCCNSARTCRESSLAETYDIAFVDFSNNPEKLPSVFLN
jgi:hypothetical protein